jgi:hypothetical protein
MEQRYFGSTRRDVAVIGQGTWYNESEEFLGLRSRDS